MDVMAEPAERTEVADYLARDLATEHGRLELLNGVVTAMAGASPRHNLIVANVARQLGDVLEPGCLLFTQDQRVHVETTQSYVYPDVVVVCDDPRFDTRVRPATLLNPRLVVEVLSESTIDKDLGAKLAHYRTMATVDEVLFVHTERRALTHVVRRGEASWELLDLGPQGEVTLLGHALSLDAVYAQAMSLPA